MPTFGGAGAAQVLAGLKGMSPDQSLGPAKPNPTLMLKPNYSGSLDGALRERFFEGMHPLEKIQYLSLRKLTGFKTNFHLEEVDPPVPEKSRTLAAKRYRAPKRFSYDKFDYNY